MNENARNWPTVTASRARDLVIFIIILAVMLPLSERLRVYYAVTVVDVTVTRILANGREETLPTPGVFARPGGGFWRPEEVVDLVKPQIENYMRSSAWSSEAAAGTRFEWTIRWARNSTHLDDQYQYIWEAGDAEGK
jgi:hypothetical protein